MIIVPRNFVVLSHFKFHGEIGKKLFRCEIIYGITKEIFIWILEKIKKFTLKKCRQKKKKEKIRKRPHIVWEINIYHIKSSNNISSHELWHNITIIIKLYRKLISHLQFISSDIELYGIIESNVRKSMWRIWFQRSLLRIP